MTHPFVPEDDSPLRELAEALNAHISKLHLEDGDLLVVSIKDGATALEVQRFGLALGRAMKKRPEVDCIIIPETTVVVEKFDKSQMRKLGWVKENPDE